MEHLPLGTHPLGSAARITIAVDKQRCVHGVVLSYNKDGGAYRNIAMRWYGERGDLDLYCTTLELGVGLYFYCFDVSGVRVGADSDLNPIEGGEDYHLTVYDKCYAAPDFLNGGLFYQIMVDRFACAAPRRSCRAGKDHRIRAGAQRRGYPVLFRGDGGGQAPR